MELDFRRLFESSPAVLAVLTPDFRIVAVTDAFARVAMRDRDSLIGQVLYDAFPGHPATIGANELRASLERVQRDKIADRMPVQRHEMPRPEADGGGFEQTHWLPVNSPVLDANGALLYIIHSAQDVSELVRLVLSQDAKDRASASAIREEHRRLAVSNTAMAAANDELEAFCYSVAHDLRAPLRGIQGFSQALLEDYSASVDAKGQGYLQRVASAALRMSELIDDLLNLSRISRSALDRADVDLSAMARNVAAELGRTQQRPVRVSIADGLTVSADARLMQIALENLLDNAWKFTAHTPDPHIAFGAETGPDGVAIFFVRDNGAGFDAASASKLFAPFQRLHSDKEFKGTGVGLATVQRVVRRHGGRIWASAEVNRGATFYFTLPDA
jgi:signal transduction histidine kinase